MSTQQIIDQGGAPPMPEIGEALTADFSGSELPTLLSGPRTFDGKTLWPYSLEAKHLAIMLSDREDTGGLDAMVTLKLLTNLQADYDAALKTQRDREAAMDLAFAEAVRRASGDARNLFRAQALRWLGRLTAAQRDEAVALYKSILAEAAESELISTGASDGSPNA